MNSLLRKTALRRHRRGKLTAEDIATILAKADRRRHIELELHELHERERALRAERRTLETARVAAEYNVDPRTVDRVRETMARRP